MIAMKFTQVGAIRVPDPIYQTEGASGMDLHYAGEQSVLLLPGERHKFPLGIAIELPPDTEGQIRPRSGLASKIGLGMVNAPGTIDSDYRGELHAVMINLGHWAITINPLDRIAQLVICPIVRVTPVECDTLSDTCRGTRGFGSTGVSVKQG